MRDSLVASSVWNSNFKRSLERYPGFTLVRLDFAVPECDACHLGGRVSTLLGRLTGKPYDEHDFEVYCQFVPGKLLMETYRTYPTMNQMKAWKTMQTRMGMGMELENETLGKNFTLVDFARRAREFIIDSATGRFVQS